MTLLRTFALSALLLVGMFSFPQESTASGSVGLFVGFSNYHRPYFYRPYFYRPYYRPFFWGGGFYPYHYGYGYGYGYGGYGYGYGYPYSYGRSYYIGEVRTEVKPQSARVYVDGDYVGVADDYDGWWQRLELPPGKHRLVFRAPGFEPYAVNVRLLPGRDTHIKYAMRPGQDHIADQDMRLPREEYSRRNRDRYDPDNYDRRDRRKSDKYRERDRSYDRDYDRDYDDGDDDWAEERRRDRDLDRDREDKPYFGEQQRDERESGRRSLVLTVEPSDATVYIDGNYYGTANDNARGDIEVLLPEGVHRVEVVRPGYSSFSQEITVRKDGENRLSIRLQKK